MKNIDSAEIPQAIQALAASRPGPPRGGTDPSFRGADLGRHPSPARWQIHR